LTINDIFKNLSDEDKSRLRALLEETEALKQQKFNEFLLNAERAYPKKGALTLPTKLQVL